MQTSDQQITLDEMIKILDLFDADQEIINVEAQGTVMSYRGYYEDLSIEPGDGCTVKVLRTALEAARGEEFTGYKGGSYTMRGSTPLWFADYSMTGNFITGIEVTPQGLAIASEEDKW